jgi:hypothetical protein
MVKKAMLVALGLMALSGTAWAQAPKVEITGLFGYSLADGVSGDAFKAGDGNTYNRVDPKDSMTFGFSVGFFVSPALEVGFLWRRQPTSLDISGTTSRTLGDLNIDGYHGYGAYYFGAHDTKVHPYVMGGLGATRYGSVSYTKASGASATISSMSRMSPTFGAGVKVDATPRVGVKFGVQWTPTYIKSDAAGWWCDPWWGCYVVGNAQYANQFEFVGGLAVRF